MAVLQLREFERIACGASFSPDTRTVTEKQMLDLERFAERFRAERGKSAFVHGPRRSLQAQNFVGVINLGAHQVEVLPKIEGEASQVRHNLSRMVAATLGLSLHAEAPTQSGRVDRNILDVMVRLFCDRLWKAIRQGIVRRYIVNEDNLVVLRGRLNVGQQLRHNLARPDRLHCSFDEFTSDNLVNRVLRLAVRLLLKASPSSGVGRSLSELLFCFQDVTDILPGSINWEQVRTDRLSGRYEPLLRLSRLFIEGASPDLITGHGDGFAILFDMNELFEEYIGRVAMRVFGQQGLQVRLQGPKKHLASTELGAGAFEMRPDIVVSNGIQPTVIIDTKWKRLEDRGHRESVSSADMYQMLAYGHRYGCDDVVLLYPHHAALEQSTGTRSRYFVKANVPGEEHAGIRVKIATVSLTDLSTVPEQLRRIALH